MRLIANEKSIPRIHLVGTLLIVLLLTLGLAGYNLWQSRQDAQSSFDRIEQGLAEQNDARLKAEMHHAITTLEFIRSQTEAALRESIVQQVDSAYQIAEAIYTRESALRPAAEVRKMIVETLRPIRFHDGRGYFFIDDMDGQFILLPTSPQLEGKTLLDNQDDTGHFIMRGLIAAARLPRGEGFSRYRWYTPENPAMMAEKLSYVRHFEPYDWLIGTGDYLYTWEERQKQEALLHLRSHSFGTTGYVVLFDADGQLLLSPSNAALEGKTEADLPVFERSVREKLLSTARAGGGIVHYDWPQADTGTLAKKRAYVQTYAPWQWVVMTTMFDDEVHAAVAVEQQNNAQLITRQALANTLAGLMALVLGLTVSLIFSRWMRQLFKEYHRNNLAQQDALRRQADVLRETQASLQESEHYFRALANGGTALIWTSGADKLCNYFNEPWLRYTGRTLEQEFGNGWTEGVHPDDFEHCLDIYVSHFDRREPFSMEYRLRKSSGEYGWIIDLGNPRHDREGNFIGYIGYCYDITDRKLAEKELQRMSQIIENTDSIAVFKDSELRYLAVNQAYLRLTGKKSLAEVAGKTDLDLFKDVTAAEQIAEYMNNDRAALELPVGQVLTVVESSGMEKGTPRTFLTKKFPVYDRDAKTCLGVATLATEITDLKRMESALFEAKEKAQAANQAKSEFLANMSHEIRTPLNGIMGMLQLLETTTLDEEQRQFCSLGIQSTNRLTSLLSDILDLSRVEASMMLIRTKRFDLRGVLTQTLDLFEPVAVQTGVTLTRHLDPGLPIWVVGDSIRLQQVLTNLISNSFKFTKRGHVHVEAYALPSRSNDTLRVFFAIEDTGCGIADEDLGNLFQPFTQVSQGYTRNHQGAGLGLTISKQLVGLMDGNMAVESEAGVGTTFVFCVTFSNDVRPHEDEAAPESRTAPPMSLRILLAEDDETTGFSISRLLEKSGHSVTVARNGQEALEMHAANDFDLILMDVSMPVMDGIKACQRIRGSENPHKRDIPIIALTAYAMAGDKEKFLAAGMNGYVAKPVKMESLMQMMSETLAENRR